MTQRCLGIYQSGSVLQVKLQCGKFVFHIKKDISVAAAPVWLLASPFNCVEVRH